MVNNDHRKMAVMFYIDIALDHNNFANLIGYHGEIFAVLRRRDLDGNGLYRCRPGGPISLIAEHVGRIFLDVGIRRKT